MEHLKRFERELNSSLGRVERLALLIGTLVEPGLDLDAYQEQLLDIVETVKAHLPADLRGRAQAEALVQTLHDELGFGGDPDNYYDPSNSFFHRVLERRTGLPITLSLLYMVVGRHLDIRLEGMGFPGHFMVRYEDDEGGWLLDPFNGAVLAENAVSDYLGRIFSQPVQLNSSVEHYQVSDRLLLLRILNNLRAIYLSNENLSGARDVLDFMVLVEPNEPELWRERGLIQYQRGRLLAAESDLRRYFSRRDRLYLFVDSPAVALSGVQRFVQIGILWPGDSNPTQEEGEVLGLLDQMRSEIDRMN